jgi:hypothetical protein
MVTAAGDTDRSRTVTSPAPLPEVAVNAYVWRPAGSVIVRA